MTIWRMRIVCWMTKATNTHSGYVILIAFHCNNCCRNAPQYYAYTYIACLVIFSYMVIFRDRYISI